MAKTVNLPGYTYRMATLDDLVAFYGAAPREQTRAFIFHAGDKIVAIGGVKRVDGRLVAFSEIKPDANLSKMTIGRMARIVMEMIRTYKVPIWAAAEQKGEDTAKMVKHYGFEYQATNHEAEIYTLWPTR